MAEISYYRGGMRDTNRRDLREPAASACDAECDDDGTATCPRSEPREAQSLTAAVGIVRAEPQRLPVTIRALHSGLYWQVVGSEEAPRQLRFAARPSQSAW